MHLKYATAFVGAMLLVVFPALPLAASGDTLANVRSAAAIFTDPTTALAARRVYEEGRGLGDRNDRDKG